MASGPQLYHALISWSRLRKNCSQIHNFAFWCAGLWDVSIDSRDIHSTCAFFLYSVRFSRSTGSKIIVEFIMDMFIAGMYWKKIIRPTCYTLSKSNLFHWTSPCSDCHSRSSNCSPKLIKFRSRRNSVQVEPKKVDYSKASASAVGNDEVARGYAGNVENLQSTPCLQIASVKQLQMNADDRWTAEERWTTTAAS